MLSEKSKQKPKRKNTIRFNRIWLIFLLIAFLAGFSKSVVPTFFPEAVQDVQHLQIHDVESVIILDTWSGFVTGSPYRANYVFTILDGALVGSATYLSGHGVDSTTDTNVEIPTDIANEFFQILGTAQIIEGQYEPLIETTDDYPDIKINIYTSDGTIEIFTQSQGEEHIPWGATINDKNYIINSGIPEQALNILEPYFVSFVPDTMYEAANYNR